MTNWDNFWTHKIRTKQLSPLTKQRILPFQWSVYSMSVAYFTRTTRWQQERSTLQRRYRFMYFQKCNCVASFPISTFLYLWAIYIYSYDRSTYLLQQIGWSIVWIQRHMNVGIGNNAAQFLFLGIFVSFSVLCLCSAYQTGLNVEKRWM